MRSVQEGAEVLRAQAKEKEELLRQQEETIRSMTQGRPDYEQIGHLEQQLGITNDLVKERDKTIETLTKERDDLANDFFQMIDENVALKDKVKELQQKSGYHLEENAEVISKPNEY